MANTPLTSRASTTSIALWKVWGKTLEKPVDKSQSLTNPAESVDKAKPSSPRKVTCVMRGGTTDAMDLVIVAFGFGESPPTCQNLTFPSLCAEIRDVVYKREEILLSWEKTPTRREVWLVSAMFQT